MRTPSASSARATSLSAVYVQPDWWGLPLISRTFMKLSPFANAYASFSEAAFSRATASMSFRRFS